MIAAIIFTVAIGALSLGSARAAWALPPRLAPDRYAIAAIACAIGVSAFLVPVALVGRLTGSFDAGLCAAAIAGLALVFAVRKPKVPAVAPAPRARWFIAAMILVAVLYGYLSLRYQMHDERALFGHKSMVEHLRHNVYPPYAPPLPEIEARYHYGFDVVAGAFARAYDFSSDAALDVTTVFFALFMSLAAAAFVSACGAGKAAPFAALAIHLGAGMAAFLLAGVEGRHPRCLIQYHHPSCNVELFPTQLLNVFQHPVSAGVPLALVFAMIAPHLIAPLAERARARTAVILAWLILGALSLSQVVYFGLSIAAFLTILPFAIREDKKRNLLRVFSVVFLALSTAVLEGGMFAPNPYVESGLVAFRRVPGFPPNEGPLNILWHHAVNLGVMFLLIPYFAWYLLKKDRQLSVLLLLSFGIGGILAAHLLVYTRSWDIVKFPSAASFVLVLVYAVLVDARLADRPPPWAWLRRTGRLLVCGSGIVTALYLVFPLRDEVRPYPLGGWHPDPLVQKAIDWLYAHNWDRRELVYAQSNVAEELAVGGGISVVAQDADLYYLGVRNDLLAKQQGGAAQIRATLSKKSLDDLKVRWLVLSDEEIANLGPAARTAIEDRSRFEVAAEFPGDSARRRRRIFRVL